MAAFLIYFVFQALMVHLVPMLTADGLDSGLAVETASILGLAMIAGKIASALMLDSARGRAACAIFLTLVAGGQLILSVGGFAYWTRPVAVALLGLGIGGMSPAIPFLVAKHFGMRRFGTLFGIVTSAMPSPTPPLR